MSFSNKGSRLIVVRGEKFRWKQGSGVVAQKVEGDGSKLLARFDTLGHVEPKQAATVLEYALDNGWEPDRPGKPFSIPNGCDLIPEFPLWNAVVQGNAVEVKALLDAGKDPNTWFQGRVMLNLAIYSGDTETVRLLLEAGANPDGDGDWIPLIMAVWFGNLEIIQFLLAHGAEVNARNAQGQTALACATAWESYITLRYPDEAHFATVRKQYEPIAQLLRSAGGTE